MSMDDFWNKVRSDIEREDFSIVCVVGEADSPSFAYTVGLHEFGYPELVIFGLRPEIAGTLIHDAKKQMFDRCSPFRDMEEDSSLIRGFKAIYRVLDKADACTEHVTAAAAHYGHDVDVVQIVWPDKAGKFPWEDECDQRMAEIQSGIAGWRQKAN